MKYRTIIVDDEQPALTKLTYLLEAYDDFELIGAFDNADDVLNSVEKLRPQVAFLDIAMPGHNGMELASILQARSTDRIEIIFITAFDQYAVSAFEINAADYLLKPVSKERFHKSILRIQDMFASAMPDPSGFASAELSRPMLHAFGKLEITGCSIIQPEWRTAKVRELFALFLQNRPNGIYRQTLLKTLWGNLSEEKALSNLNTCNYYLRKFLKETQTDISLKYKRGYYSLDLGSVVCDADIFERAETMAASLSEKNLRDVLYAASLYRGKYFEDVKCDWANLLRDQYDIRYAGLRVNIASYYASAGQLKEANSQAAMALDIDPLCENAWKLLLKNYKASDDRTHFETTLRNRAAAYQNLGLPAPVLDLSQTLSE